MNGIYTDIMTSACGADKDAYKTGLKSGAEFSALYSSMLEGGDLLSGATRATVPAECAVGSMLATMVDDSGIDMELGVTLMRALMETDFDMESSMTILSALMSACAIRETETAYGGIAYLTGLLPSGGCGEEMPANAWLPANPEITGDRSCRSPLLLRSIISQFNVESCVRYAPHKYGNDTYCNIFVWDVTSALGAEIPHYVDAETGRPRRYPDIAGAMELDANATCDWLQCYGSEYGWREVSASEAQEYANRGCPAVTAWKNTTGGAGHVQIVCPSQNGAFNEARGVAIAQAGSRNFEYGYITSVYSGQNLHKVRYYVHE
jgi:hypothetical protein